MMISARALTMVAWAQTSAAPLAPSGMSAASARATTANVRTGTYDRLRARAEETTANTRVRWRGVTFDSRARDAYERIQTLVDRLTDVPLTFLVDQGTVLAQRSLMNALAS